MPTHDVMSASPQYVRLFEILEIDENTDTATKKTVFNFSFFVEALTWYAARKRVALYYRAEPGQVHLKECKEEPVGMASYLVEDPDGTIRITSIKREELPRTGEGVGDPYRGLRCSRDVGVQRRKKARSSNSQKRVRGHRAKGRQAGRASR